MGIGPFLVGPGKVRCGPATVLQRTHAFTQPSLQSQFRPRLCSLHLNFGLPKRTSQSWMGYCHVRP